MDSFQIFLKDISGGTSTLNGITNETPISELKILFHKKKGTPMKNIRMIFAGKDLDDNSTVGKSGIRKESTIMIVNRFPSQGIVKHSADFFGDTLNDFI